MFDTFVQSFLLRNTYRANSIIWAIKSLPLIGRLFPSTLYSFPVLKMIVCVISAITEFLMIFVKKGLYLLVLFGLTFTMPIDRSDSFVHMLIFLTIIGALCNTSIFSPTKDKYYAIFNMRMDAREYTIVDFVYFLAKTFVGFLSFSLVFGLLSGASVITCLAIPFYVVCTKLCFTALSLSRIEKEQKSNANKNPVVKRVLGYFVSVIMFFPVGLLYLGYSLPEYSMWIATAVVLVGSFFSARYMIKFNSYRYIYTQLFDSSNTEFGGSTKQSTAEIEQTMMQKKISVDVTLTSNKKGYRFFNEIFMKRHSKILTKPAKIVSFVIAVVFVAIYILMWRFPKLDPYVNVACLKYLPYMLFFEYLLNTGPSITKAMFMNCDHSMLTYRFYRQPKALLLLFIERLKTVVLINLIPAAVLSVCLPLTLYVSGGTDQILNYVALFISVIAMSIFFSVHNMVLYYLFQPYNINLEIKGGAYKIISVLTYLVSYLGIKTELPTMQFGLTISAFCVIYVVVALLLTYRIAPKTFKLRN